MTGILPVIIAFVLGGVIAFLISDKLREGRERKPIELEHGDLPLLIDLLRRAHGATAACLTVGNHDPIWAVAQPGPQVHVLDRAVAVSRLAMGDGRNHLLKEEGTLVAAGDGRQMGGALVFVAGELDTNLSDRVIADLRRVFADIASQMSGTPGKARAEGNLPEWLVGGPESVEGISFQLCEAVQDVTGRSNVLVLRDPNTQLASVVAVSSGADRRLLGVQVSPSAAVGRACMSDVPIVGADMEDLFGSVRSDRRQRVEGGVAFPLWDLRECIGALAILGEHTALAVEDRDRAQWLIKNAGPRLGRAATLRTAEQRAMTDELTGLPNRRSLERAMHDHAGGPCAVLCIDLDHFKALNDGFGHAAGDAALRHVSAIFKNALRAGDVPARIGGEEFALWLPGATLEKALDVANRVRDAVRGSILEYAGNDIGITCSIGVASIPESVSQVDNLLGAGDAAMYRAKEAGRDRIEVSERKSL
jgi:diguanylate cyclase (GGDEF)-like protein